jgi:F-type H+-transporting ATPase subunit gamma
MEKREGGKICLVVIAGDRGLAGGYNANIFRLMREYPEATVIPIGKRACERYKGELISAEKFSYKEAKEIAEDFCRKFLDGDFDKFGIVATKYNSLMSQEAYIKWVLPIQKSNKRVSSSAIFEPDEITVLNSAIPEYVAGIIISAVKESFACEVAARRVAMDSAGKNAKEMLDDLGLQYNRARQGAITQEITEIVAGSEA